MKPFFLVTALAGLMLAMPVALSAAAEPTLSIDLGKGVKLQMVLVHKGTFVQGSPADEPGRNDDEPQRKVTLTHDFYLGKFPVTVGQFTRFVEATGYKTEAERGTSGGFGFDGKALVQAKQYTWRSRGFKQADEHPVTIVTFDDAQAFLAWLSKQAHRKVLLPTEAEWEYACRAGSTTPFYTGKTADDLREIAWCKSNAGDGTRPVGQKQPNAWGLFDMSGNVYEWCRDWYGPYAGATATDPEQTRAAPGEPPRRVLRGGSWLKDADKCRSAARYRNTPASRNADNGFRVAATVEVIVEQEAGQDKAGPAPLAHQPPRPAAPAANAPAAPRPSGPHAVEHAHSAAAGGSVLGLACLVVTIGGLGLLLVVILMALLRRPKDTMPLGDDLPPVSQEPGHGSVTGGRLLHTEVADDGFWLHTGGVTPGSLIRYQYLLHGAMCHDTVTAEAGPRQFVYTGHRPSEVSVLEAMPPEAGPGPTPIPATVVDDRPETPSQPAPRTPPFAGFPAAY